MIGEIIDKVAFYSIIFLNINHRDDNKITRQPFFWVCILSTFIHLKFHTITNDLVLKVVLPEDLIDCITLTSLTQRSK